MLVLRLAECATIAVGRFGPLDFTAGWYLYVGSAFGPGGVQARCAHHQRIAARPRWHIDYLRAHGQLQDIWFSHDARHREHQWADLLGGIAGMTQPVRGFGASDCGCNSHLFRSAVNPHFAGFTQLVFMKLKAHKALKCKVLWE